MSKETLGQSIKHYRKINQLTQKDLASKLGIGQTAIANYEKNLRVPNHKLLIKIAGLFSISVDDLLKKSPSKSNITPDEFIKLVIDTLDPFMINVVRDLAQSGVSVFKIYSDYLKPLMYEVGDRWEKGQLSIIDEHQISRIAESMIDVIIPYNQPIRSSKKKIIFTALNSEKHILGLKIIAEFFKYYGWKTYYLGNNTPWPSISKLIADEQVDYVVISSTYLSNFNTLNAFIDFIRSQSDAKVVVGGQTISRNPQWKSIIKADYYLTSEEEIIDFIEKHSND